MHCTIKYEDSDVTYTGVISKYIIFHSPRYYVNSYLFEINNIN